MTGAENSSLHRGQQIELQVDGLGDGADALCRHGGQAVFVPGALPGERIRATVVQAKKTAARADLVEVLEPAAERREPRCPHFGPCSGCRLQHFDPAASSAHKFTRLRDLINSRLRSKPAVQTAATPSPWGQRLRLEMLAVHEVRPLRYGLPLAGRDARDTPHPFPLEDCPTADPQVLAVAKAATAVATERNLEALRAVIVQRGVGTGDIAVTVVAETGRLPHAQRIADAARSEGARSVSLNVHEGRNSRLLGRRTIPIVGRPRLHQNVLGVILHTDPTTQVPPTAFAAESLVRSLRELAGENPGKVVDLFSGAGLTALAIAHQADSVHGIELRDNAMQDAELAAEACELAHKVHFELGRVDDSMISLEKKRPDTVVVDPPTSGCTPETLAGIARVLTPSQIVYIGRNPGTLVRDLRGLEELGFKTQAIHGFDIDPLAPGLMAVAHLTRAED